jgi:hypothetical protein
MKKFFYSSIVTVLLNLAVGYLCYKYWSLPAVIVWAFFIVLYTERSSEWRKSQKSNSKK